ncbi:MAG: hypothetical protein GY947_07425 [Rhodobacteraceae bacterium]|nr:hypothetical protein [Paracoccaceae bacterium]
MNTKQYSKFLALVVIVLAASIGVTHQTSAETNPDATSVHQQQVSTTRPAEANLTQRKGVFMLDYQLIRLPGNESIDLLGYHILTPINDWLSIGLGSYAPFLKGEFGGFMAFGGLVNARRKIAGNLFVNGGLSFGGGGGGKSVAHSVELSGTGGYVKGYIGLGYDFKNFSLGANISRMKFFESAIDSTQFNIFLQKPFSYVTGPYGNSGDSFTSVGQSSGSETVGSGFGSMMSAGLDNYSQIDPVGSYKGTINAVDLQFSGFMTKNSYWYYAVGVGYKGRPAYNQVFGGLGFRVSVSPRINLYGQLGMGSGGYAPSVIDTGSGLLLYPKLSAEYMLNKNLGLALTTGYMFALDGSSKNNTFGAVLNYHLRSANTGNGANNSAEGRYEGYRLSFAHETGLNMRVRGSARKNLNMLTVQGDRIISDHVYIPFRAGISYADYRGFPGYGEVSTGIGLQSKYSKASRVQFFGELQVGANVEGSILRAGLGLNYELKEALALRGLVGQTIGDRGFRATNLALGLTYRFSLPNF